VRGTEHRDDLIDETEIVLGKDAEGIADLVAGCSRLRPWFAASRTAGAAGVLSSGRAAGASAVSASASFFTMRVVSLPPGTHRFSRSSLRRKIALA
jgi:hypothetical protein